MMKNERTLVLLAVAGILLLALMGGAFADDVTKKEPEKAGKPQPTVVLVQLPMALEGEYKPMGEEAIQALMEKNVEARVPAIDVVMADPSDPKLAGIDLFGDLSKDDAAALAKLYKAAFVSWGSLKLTKSKRVMQAGPDSPTYQYQITVEGAARVKVYETKADDIVVEQRMFQLNNGLTRSVEDSPIYLALEEDLAKRCVADLSSSLVQVVLKRLEKQEKKTDAQPDAPLQAPAPCPKTTP